jgi:hypothetical protein
MHALANQEAAIFLDEGWVFMIGAKNEMERLGKTARSLNVAAWLADQGLKRVQHLSDYISQMFVFHMRGGREENATTAFRMFEIDPEFANRVDRVVAEPEAAGYSYMDGTGSTTHNRMSLKPLFDRDQETGEIIRTVRGAVAYYIDLHNHCVPIEIRLPESFLAMSSTNPQDIKKRLEAELSKTAPSARGAV